MYGAKCVYGGRCDDRRRFVKATKETRAQERGLEGYTSEQEFGSGIVCVQRFRETGCAPQGKEGGVQWCSTTTTWLSDSVGDLVASEVGDGGPNDGEPTNAVLLARYSSSDAAACCADIEFCASGNNVGEASGEVELEPKLSRLSMLVASAMAPPPPPDALLALPFRAPSDLDTGGSASNQLAVEGGTIGRGCWRPNASEKSSSEKTGRSSGAGGGGGGRLDADRPLFLL